MSDDTRLDQILEVLMAYARQDFSPRLRVSAERDEVDAIATGINILAEELDGEVASRRELEAAYARVQATQEQLVVAEKLAAVGQLASGVAHELNNPVSWVLLGLDLVRRRLASARQAAAAGRCVDAELAAMDETLSDVHAGMERVRGVLGDLRAFSRATAETQHEVDLDDVVRSACQLARPSYLSVAKLVLDLGAPPPIAGDRARLGQLVSNLVVNAAHAVADHGTDHEIRVSTRVIDDEVLLAVEDSGPGIPDELAERVFEPYFTTKPSEVGTGLGLALVRQIAERHGGTARATRGQRGGARMEVRFPRGTIAPSMGTPTPAIAPVLAATSARRARLLITDDEPMLLRSLEETIAGEHDVVVALGGAAALAILANDRAFDLVICDLHMPHVDGVSVHEWIAAVAPELLPRVLVMTGGSVTPRATQFLATARPRVLPKPIDVDALLDIVREVAGARVSDDASRTDD